MAIKVGIGCSTSGNFKTLEQKAQETGFGAACARIFLRGLSACNRWLAYGFAGVDNHFLKIAQRASTSKDLEWVLSHARPESAAQKLALEKLNDLQRKQILQGLANLAESLAAKELELAREASTREELEETLLMVRPDSYAQKIVLQKLASVGWFTLLPRKWS
jgi:hypothetical protein